MLKRFGSIGLLGISCLAIGLLLLVLGRGSRIHLHIWRDWLLAFVLVMVGGALAIAWALTRLVGTGEEEVETKPKAAVKGAGGRPGS